MSKRLKDIFMYVLGGIIIIGFFAILVIVFLVPMPETNKDIGLIVIGAMTTKFSDIISYFFGSSKGSSDKNELINKSHE